jgi:hypothetical protein
MMYMIKRGEQEFGPYSGNDIQQYLNSGNIVDTDLVRAEGSDRWLPVKDILAKKASVGSAAAPVANTPTPAPSYTPDPAPQPVNDPFLSPSSTSQASDFGSTGSSWGAPAAGYASQAVSSVESGVGQSSGASGAMKNGAPLPPGLNWVMVIVFAFLTCGIFALVYLFMQAGWVQKLDQQSKAKKFLVLLLALYALVFVLMFISIGLQALMPDSFIGPMVSMISPILNIGVFVLYLLAVFNMRSSLEGYFNAEEPINLKLNPILVFFFAPYYFQYHFNRITTWKTTGTLPN